MGFSLPRRTLAVAISWAQPDERATPRQISRLHGSLPSRCNPSATQTKDPLNIYFILLLGIQISDLATEPQPICVVQEMGESSILAVSWSTRRRPRNRLGRNGVQASPTPSIRHRYDSHATRRATRRKPCRKMRQTRHLPIGDVVCRMSQVSHALMAEILGF
jgi:hypothetical protein